MATANRKRSERKPEITVDRLRYYYTKVVERAIPQEDVLKDDITLEVLRSLESRIKHGELINIQIRGEVTTGKSTAGGFFLDYITRLLMFHGLQKDRNIRKELDKYIFSDQVEFLRFIGKDVTNMAIQIDEYNRLVQTGYNATTEMTLFDYYSDTFAQKFIHRISCSPSNITDINAYLVLDVYGRDINNKITQLKVMYRDITNPALCVIGHMKIDVSRILRTGWYENYRIKKFKRMELMQKEGIRDVRETEMSHMAWKVYTKLKRMAEIQKVPPEIIHARANIERRREGRIYSMMAQQEIEGLAQTLLNLISKKHAYEKKLNSAKLDIEERKKIHEAIQITTDTHKQLETEEKRLGNIYQEYLRI